MVHFDEALDYVCGEAHRAYAYVPPALWVRHILFVKGQKDGLPPYILICDEAEAGAAEDVRVAAPRRLPDIAGKRRPEHSRITRQPRRPLVGACGWQARRQEDPRAGEQERTSFIQWQTPVPQCRDAFTWRACRKKKRLPALRRRSVLIEATGGWAVEVRCDAATDIALFRSQRAQSVTVGEAATAGTAAVLRKRQNTPTTFCVLGKP